MSKKIILAVAGWLLLSVLGCGDSSQKNTASPGASGVLYVSNQLTDSILRFDNGFTANGNIAPAAIITGSATQLAGPGRLLLDEQANRLFVINTLGASISIFDNASTRTGNVAPERVIGLIGASGADLALDKGRDQLYVSLGNTVEVFAPASTINGNVAPVRVFTTGTTIIDTSFLDVVHDRLFLAEKSKSNGSVSIDIFENASQLAGTVSPSRSIAGAGNGLSTPLGLVLDNSDRLIVNDIAGTGSILIFSQASSANGDVPPSAVITGSNTGLSIPFQVALNRGNGDFYVADASASSVMVFNSSNPSSGNVAPVRAIAGSNTGFGPPAVTRGVLFTTVGIALDTAR